MILTFLYSFLIINIMALLFASMGMSFSSRLCSYLNLPKAPQFVLGYFFGLAFFLGLWRFLDLVFQSAKVSFFIALALLIGFAIYRFRKIEFNFRKNISKILSLFIICLSVQVAFTTFWSRDVYEDAYSTVGSGHSPRYANITLHQINIDRIPVFGLNYTQSILSAIPIYFGVPSALVGLTIWLGTSIIFFSLLTFYIFKQFSLSTFHSILGVIIVGFGNSTVSMKHHLIMDTGNPFYLVGYSDTLHSIGVLSLILLLVYDIIFLEEQKFKATTFIFKYLPLSLLFYINSIMAPQNVVSTIAIFGLLFLYVIFSEKQIRRKILINTIPVFLVFCVIIIISTRSGGLLTPGTKIDATELPGVEKLNSNQIQPEFSMSLPYHIGNYRNWIMKTTNDSVGFANRPTGEIVLNVFRSAINSILVIFFPCLGILLAFYYGRNRPMVNILAKISLLFLVCGLIIVWPMRIYGTNWALTRFFIPGVYFSFICLVVSLNTRFSDFSPRQQKVATTLVCLLVCWGPYLNFFQILEENFNNTETFRKRLTSIIDYTYIPKK